MVTTRQSQHLFPALAVLFFLIGGAVFLPAAWAQGNVEAVEETRLDHEIDRWFGNIIDHYLAPVLFASVYEFEKVDGDGRPVLGEDGTPQTSGFPLIVVVLVAGGLFFTIRYGFVNIRLFFHAIRVVRGHYDDPEDAGEISHFKALTSALAATVGLGNIGGVAVAITTGGAGAVFWMWVTAIFGMSMKFSSCTLAQLYRRFKEDGHVLGGPMVYLKDGLRERAPAWISWVGYIFSPLFAILTIMAAFGGGNMYQSNQTYEVMRQVFGFGDSEALPIAVGLLLFLLVGIVIIGGIKRIGEVTSKVVPAMCVGYVLVCLIVVVTNFRDVPAMLLSIPRSAFSLKAGLGGFLGIVIVGMQRAAFSNEAGLGSAAIAHAAARTNEPVREGLVAMLGPFIDTVVVCTMTALAILITGVHKEVAGMGGVEITARAFGSVHGLFPYFLVVAVFIFAYSTLISWSYYGERAVEYLTGPYSPHAVGAYRIVYCLVAAVGPLLSLTNVITFADMMLLSMAFPNILGMVLLSGRVRQLKNDYEERLAHGEMQVLR